MANFLDSLVVSDGCWKFDTNRIDGYATLSFGGRTRVAHRVAYEALVGPIGDGLELDHLCKTRNCVRPSHLEPVTPLVNTSRARNWNRDKTHCRRGHELAGNNVRVTLRRSAHRVGQFPRRDCLACDRIRSLANYYRKKVQV